MNRYLMLPFFFFLMALFGACVMSPTPPGETPAPQATLQPTLTATSAVTATAVVTPAGTVTPTTGVTPTTALTPTAAVTPAVALTATPVLTPTTSAAAAPQGQDATIAAILAARPEFATMNRAVASVNLINELSGDVPYTLFAPTEDAFAALPPGVLDNLPASPSILAQIIQNHLLIEEASSARLVRLGSVLTALGQTLPVTLTATGVVRLGNATLVEPDIDAANGVIHAIDIVLLPADLVITPTVTSTITSTPAVQSATQVTATQAVTTAQIITTIAPTATIADLVRETDDLEMLEKALDAAGLLQALQLPGKLTLFAPTNAAFAAIPPQQLQALLNNTADLADVMQYHLVADNVLVADLARLGGALSTSGQRLTVAAAADGAVLANNAEIVQADIVTANGVIHVIDFVLSPPAE